MSPSPHRASAARLGPPETTRHEPPQQATLPAACRSPPPNPICSPADKGQNPGQQLASWSTRMRRSAVSLRRGRASIHSACRRPLAATSPLALIAGPFTPSSPAARALVRGSYLGSCAACRCASGSSGSKCAGQFFHDLQGRDEILQRGGGGRVATARQLAAGVFLTHSLEFKLRLPRSTITRPTGIPGDLGCGLGMLKTALGR
jgi:hypothetical protein